MVIAFNTYREAVRARILHGLFALALATAGYALIVGQFALNDTLRVVSDLGAASISVYAIIVAIVIGATSLYRELELKTVFPILTRPISRGQYLVGKYLGALLTLFVFVAANAGALLLAMAYLGEKKGWIVVASVTSALAVVLVLAYRFPRQRTMMPVLFAVVLLALGLVLSDVAPDDRRVIAISALLTLLEVGIIAAFATLFSSFSSPFLTAVFTFSLFLIGRSADTLANLPARVFGPTIKSLGEVLSQAVPNLMLYAPPRPLLTGEAVAVPLVEYLGRSTLHAVGWALGALALAVVIFRRRDFL